MIIALLIILLVAVDVVLVVVVLVKRENDGPYAKRVQHRLAGLTWLGHSQRPVLSRAGYIERKLLV